MKRGFPMATRTAGGWLLAVTLLSGVKVDAVLEAGNDYYRVYVADTGNVGQYTATTGPAHPAGNGLNVIFGNGAPGTSFTTIRSYSSGTDYVQDDGKTSSFTVVPLGPLGSVIPIGTTGFRTVYNITGNDQLTVTQDIKVNGTTFEDSTIELTTTVQNNGTTAARIGIRHLIDYQIGTDDGPTFQPVNVVLGDFVGCDPRVSEAQYLSPSFDAYVIEDNDVNPNPPTFNIFGSVNGPAGIQPQPTGPDLLQFTCWPTSFGSAFTYTVDPTRDVATTTGTCQSGTGGGDSAVLYFFGANNASALLIAPGESKTVSISLFLRPIAESVVTNCITRDARFWFTRGTNANPNCVTLHRAIRANCDSFNLGFLSIPRGYHNDNHILDVEDALIEALGLYYRGRGLTGELGGTQSQKRRASALCVERKRTAVELIAALANTVMFGTRPENCVYINSGVHTNFPADLIEQARLTLTGEDIAAVRAMGVLLRKFNLSGARAQFPVGDDFVECSQDPSAVLRRSSRDPTTQNSCPGVNDSCQAAEAVVFPATTNIFARPLFARSVDLTPYTDQLPSLCGTGGREAVWKITPSVGQRGRRFTVNTLGSNFDTVVSIYRGDCDLLEPVNCNDDADLLPQSKVSFSTDGESVYYIVAEGKRGAYGRLKLQVTSP